MASSYSSTAEGSGVLSVVAAQDLLLGEITHIGEGGF